MSRTLLVKNADVLVTMDDDRREIRGGGVLVEGNRIVAVGPSAELPGTADEVIDAGGHVVLFVSGNLEKGNQQAHDTN